MHASHLRRTASFTEPHPPKNSAKRTKPSKHQQEKWHIKEKRTPCHLTIITCRQKNTLQHLLKYMHTLLCVTKLAVQQGMDVGRQKKACRNQPQKKERRKKETHA
ncbi:hypothetical protein TWF569_004358 [Orbilia oligospora]|uniref:Uncharacterized protein n=1 Tax=Orbilia oligospora TaxID=2813651 RepID=A0A7C8JBE2_ORBOL|nr:hypothetical protein TWF103_002982 [Orbilia oligospora]KAF3097478.1 hypothetical protein TWF706_007338 [Orbilia oligospora]KAF3108027.1 hypothetical protein TWF102_011509 [Orbilia oligospora]KAF3129627.1 hypothetical protein TWF594_010920 [Orbilia oligospora]KAF3150816.1 hypothetical protein TWF569_004358 [Orbilia oligospora]